MNAKRSSAWVLNSDLAGSSLAIAAIGVVAERLRHLIVDQDYASSNLVDPAVWMLAWPSGTRRCSSKAVNAGSNPAASAMRPKL